MKQGIILLGDALIDFIPTDASNLLYHKSPGGAPANVAVGVTRLGTRSTFLGKLGDVVVSKLLDVRLEGYGVETSNIQLSSDLLAGVVFFTNAADGERSFEFYIDPSADRFLEADEINEADLTSHKILHFGSISLIGNPAKEATETAVKLAKENDMLVSYDPNLRLSLWESEQ